MNQSLLSLFGSALWIATLCSLPVVLVAALSAFVVDFVQARLGIRDTALPTAVRLIVGAAVLALLGPVLVSSVVSFATQVWMALPNWAAM